MTTTPPAPAGPHPATDPSRPPAAEPARASFGGAGAPVELADARRTARLLNLLGGAALLAAPALLIGGSLTSPPQVDNSPQAYIASLHADPALTALSAGLFHYCWVVLAFGVLAAIGLVRGARGRALTTAGGVLASFGSVQMSGMLLADHFTGSLGVLPPDQGASIFLAAMTNPWTTAWLYSGEAGIVVGVLLLLVGLARAGVLPWWSLGLLVAGVVGMVFLPALLPAAAIVCGVMAMAPLLMTGARLMVRATRAVDAAASA